MKKVITGNHAVSYGALLSRVEVIAAYPITPQTQVVELLSEFCAEGKLKAKFVKVESEHSAMATCIGASAAGARAFTATSAQGLALMHELLHWAAGGRLPIVLANINRAMAPGWSIWTDQNDSLSQRDTGWMQIYCESNQEVLDSVIQGYKIAEQVYIPLMLVLDAFVLSHTSEIVDIPSQEQVDRYLPPFKPKYKLDVNDPHAFGGLLGPDHYMEIRYLLQKDMERAMEITKKADIEFKEIFGRSYGVIEAYKCEDAEIIMVTSGTVTSTARTVIDKLRERDKRVGLLKIRMFRPFPSKDIKNVLLKAKKVLVVDRNISYGLGGIFFEEIKSVLYYEDKHIPIFGFITGLGGRDVTPNILEEMIEYVETHDKPEEPILWKGVKL
ncbi:pyruvate ferredoxin oxidoreductase [Candidatus Aminicenantes bacterium AC-708-M15]|jgi:pyruvate/2-oxoacid:ferredoxin oxidoreductase alpha subunit|nr:pyruvate ferredoxin oxidoreductase [SCandidatus Aminicenantes bacterium Aminicenantia_JdfR_composite]MCP2597113.1 pyruvate ferredoxin oxidoreductase [Candidatus Aminicenantes bacterium AC-335-G13]MCP2598238.1 pyruvate ferredoxin oxidoreductase [Candidatus Aminicenantes bacterium AC-335-L06]MCP2604363.1 pyruvate ferredoxin oxidoreductase [Candidatus Aminicenantes bacterium AC-708-M15]MCP2605918.1 pyruvate ferredoxin oxidoreductase [Candidatus Aminicenantes bacterium AC-335-O07]MCP2618668.1 p